MPLNPPNARYDSPSLSLTESSPFAPLSRPPAHPLPPTQEDVFPGAANVRVWVRARLSSTSCKQRWWLWKGWHFLASLTSCTSKIPRTHTPRALVNQRDTRKKGKKAAPTQRHCTKIDFSMTESFAFLFAAESLVRPERTAQLSRTHTRNFPPRSRRAKML